jgi:diguanylate cyclase (GGDEF)-like protein
MHDLDPVQNPGSYQRLAELYHDLLAPRNLAEVLGRVVDVIGELVPFTSVSIAETVPEERMIAPLVARGRGADEALLRRRRYGEGLDGWSVEHGLAALSNWARDDPRADTGPDDPPVALVCVPLVAQNEVVGVLSIAREGSGGSFSRGEFDLAQRIGDAATLALVTAKARRQLEELAGTDELTGCLNRRGLDRHVLETIRADGSCGPAVLLFVDLDRFKSVNDHFGHSTGDLLLRHVALQLRAVTPERAAVARVGGDEFVVLLAPAEDGDAETLALQLEEAIGSIAFTTASGEVRASGTVGLARTDRPTPDGLADLLKGADEAMYARKHSGRDELPRAS